MGDLTANFDRHEFECPCCGLCEPEPQLVDSLQAMRSLAGAPITILSGHRCKSWNHKCGGALHSQHLLGRAADIVVRGVTVPDMVSLAEMIPAFRSSGIGRYPTRGFIHVDVRGMVARWEG